MRAVRSSTIAVLCLIVLSIPTTAAAHYVQPSTGTMTTNAQAFQPFTSPPTTVTACVPIDPAHFSATLKVRDNSVVYTATGSPRVKKIRAVMRNKAGEVTWVFVNDGNSESAVIGLTSPGVWSPTKDGSNYGLHVLTVTFVTTCGQRYRIYLSFDNTDASGGSALVPKTG